MRGGTFQRYLSPAGQDWRMTRACRWVVLVCVQACAAADHPVCWCACRHALRQVILRAQQSNDERLLSNPYLQIRAMLESGMLELQP